MRPSHAFPAFLLLAAATFAAPLAHAQPTASGFALDRFNPSERGSEWFVLDSLDLRGGPRPAIGLVGELADSPLVIYNGDGSTRAIPVHYQLILHPGASVVLFDRLRVGLDVPIAVFQDGQTGVVSGVTYQGITAGGAGDLRLGADVRLFGQYGDAFRLAAGTQVFVPTGNRSSYLGDGSVRVIIPRALVAGDVDWFSYAAQVGFNYRGLTDTFGGSGLGSELVFGASAGVRALQRNLLIGPELYGSTVVTNGAAFAKVNTPLEVMLGAHYLIASSVRVGAGVAPGLTKGYGEPAVRYVLSAEWAPAPEAPPPPDRDHDGILDADDACPDVAGVRTDDPKTNGCPPEEAPPPPPPADRDHDGIPDDADACPDVPGVKTDDPKTNGCPPDRDHDGILDAEDACPDVPGVKTSDPKTNGCPPDPDRDKDGIPNEQDACPDTPGPRNADPKKNGCPAAAIVGKQIVILEQVKFATGSAKILPASDAILDAVLAGGERASGDQTPAHRGPHRQRRRGGDEQEPQQPARGIGRRLARRHGVDPSRLSSEGFGMERPIDSNDTPAGRQNNRRVEFHIDDSANQ